MMVVGVKHLKQKSRNAEIRVIHTLNRVHSQRKVSEYAQDAPVPACVSVRFKFQPYNPRTLRCATQGEMV